MIIDKIVKAIQPLDNSKFIQLGKAYVYPEHLKFKRKFRGYKIPNICVSDLSVIDLYFPEQLYLYQQISNVLGIKARHGNLKENFNATYSKETKEYKKNVLDSHAVYTGEIARIQDGRVDVRRALGVNFVDRQVSNLLENFIDESGKEILETVHPSQIQYIVGPTLQTEMPTKRGFFYDETQTKRVDDNYFDDFKGAIPIDAELKSKGKGRWYGTLFDNNGFSAVKCYWHDADSVFGGDGEMTMKRISFTVLPIWTDENPKK